jgi:hypothetical protein
MTALRPAVSPPEPRFPWATPPSDTLEGFFGLVDPSDRSGTSSQESLSRIPRCLSPQPSFFLGAAHRRLCSTPGPPPFSLPDDSAIRAKQNSFPSLTASFNDSDTEFAQICSDNAITFNPGRLGFLPAGSWGDQDVTFGDLVTNFFQKRASSSNRFVHKLYNALQIAADDPFYAEYVGVEWVNDLVIKIEKRIFARLLGVRLIDATFFGQQGSFPAHGFVELSHENAINYLAEADWIALDGVDDDEARLLMHAPGIFVRNCGEEALRGVKMLTRAKADA